MAIKKGQKPVYENPGNSEKTENEDIFRARKGPGYFFHIGEKNPG